MTTPDSDRKPTSKQRLYNVYPHHVSLGDIVDFLKEFSMNGDSKQVENMIQVNINIG